ncbi:hypothetical protein [Xenorhabdus sp. PB62.4]|uniref:hypothetical protein n=1 Tax=Xenorhabdus sp. PB62.4 TaxID=1851573 RepID=UPI00165759BA|nr:hypothetical protein [Xenorhabdus sp. PB62.4]MBC8954196.1 hypothetical protein [Xenorhabdus sp. PB62.4]
MAKVTDIVSIANNTPYTMSLINGENSDQIFSIGAERVWNGHLWVPWIGKTSENYKAIKLILGPKSDNYIYVFQDYYNPSGENAVKYFEGLSMNYDGDTKEVEGDNRGGGRKVLVVNLTGRNYILKMFSGNL